MNRYKRLASTPPQGKETKRVDKTSTPDQQEIPDGAHGFDSSSLPLTSQSSVGSTSTQVTAKSRVSARLMTREKKLDPRISEGIPGKFYGGLRDVIDVEVVSIDDEPYTTNMRSSDAIRDIFIGSLNMDKNDIIGIQIAWKGRPVISFRIKNKINVDKLPANFSYDKNKVLDDGSTITQVIKCIVKGVRPPRTEDDGTRTVIFEKCGWKITHDEIDRWASHYGQVLSKVREATDNDLDPDVQPDGNTVGCGNLQVTMRVRKVIPQFLPMFGYKVKVYYKDIPKLCTNCYTRGHLRKECKNPNKPWLHYVVDFITDNENIPEDDFGSWMKKSKEYVKANPDIFNGPEDEDDLDLDDMNLGSDDDDETEDENNLTVTQASPKIIETGTITSVLNTIETLETKNNTKANQKSQPTREQEPNRGKTKKSSEQKKTK